MTSGLVQRVCLRCKMPSFNGLKSLEFMDMDRIFAMRLYLEHLLGVTSFVRTAKR